MQITKLTISAVVFGVICASAAPVGTQVTCPRPNDIGCFSMAGDVTVSNTQMIWDNGSSVPNEFVTSLGGGIYSTENGNNGITTLNIGSEPVGSTFGPNPFITFLVSPNSPLNINFIYPGLYTSTLCFTDPSTAQVGQTCTPNAGNPPTSPGPFSFVNNQPASAIQSQAQWTFTGVVPGMTNVAWEADFTSQFGNSFQQILQALNPASSNFTGSIENSYSATVNVYTTPEPGPLVMIGVGLCLLVVWKAGAAARKRQRNF